jgi:hypothetical protein
MFKDFLGVFPEFGDVIVDGTEQDRAQPGKAKKPVNRKKRVGRKANAKKYFSGETKLRAFKTQFTVTPEGRIVQRSAAVPGLMLLRRSRFALTVPPVCGCSENSAYAGWARRTRNSR